MNISVFNFDIVLVLYEHVIKFLITPELCGLRRKDDVIKSSKLQRKKTTVVLFD